VKGQNNFWYQKAFLLVPGGFSDLKKQNKYNSNWEKLLGSRNMQEKLENICIFFRHALSSESLHNLTDEHEDLDLIQAVAKQLHIKTSKELHDLREVLFPSILCAMVHAGAGIFFNSFTFIFQKYK
jgi:hypothetical protein